MLGLTEVSVPRDGSSSMVDGPPLPPACMPKLFDAGSIDTALFGNQSTSAFTVSYDGTLFVAEDASGAQNAIYRRDATGARNEMIALGSDELAEPTMDPEANVLYVRDKTALDAIVGFVRANDMFMATTTLDLPTGRRAGNQTLDLGGFRRMVVQYPDPGTFYYFIEYEGSPTAGWTEGRSYHAADLLPGAATYMVDPSLDANGLNLVFAGQNNVFVSHRSDVGQPFPTATVLMAGATSSPMLASSCRTLYAVDKSAQRAHRYQNP